MPVPYRDFNRDGIVNTADRQYLVDWINSGLPYTPKLDVNRDGQLGLGDVLLMTTANGTVVDWNEVRKQEMQSQLDESGLLSKLTFAGLELADAIWPAVVILLAFAVVKMGVEWFGDGSASAGGDRRDQP